MISRIYLVFIVFYGILYISCTNERQPNESKNEEFNSDQIQSVEVVSPEQRSFNTEVQISGTAMPNQESKIHALESGYVSKIYTDIGSKVNKGEILARLSNPEIDQQVVKAKAGLSESEAMLEMLKAEKDAGLADAKAKELNHERLSSIFQDNPLLVTQAEFDQAKADMEISKAKVMSGTAMILAQKKKINAHESLLDFASQRKTMLTIRSPFEGLVTNRYVDVGTVVQSGISNTNAAVVFVVQQVDPIRMTIEVPEADAVAINSDMDVEILFPELSNSLFKAKVSRSSGALDPATKTMRVEIDIDNDDNEIITGMYAKVNMQLSSRDEVLSLPTTAIKRVNDLAYILQVKEKKVKFIPLRKGLSNKDYFEVLNEEIDKTSQIIIEGKGLVKEGEEVNAIYKN